MSRSHSIRLTSLALLALVLIVSGAQAEIIGFGNFSNFTLNQNDSAVPPAVSSGVIEITGPAGGEARSLFHNVKQDVSEFTASFTYRVTAGSTAFNFHPSAAFVIQDSAAGVDAVGDSGQTFAYPGIGRSVALSLQLGGSGASSNSGTGLYTNGVVGGGSVGTSPVNLLLNNPVDVTLTYNGSLLHELLFDTVTGASFERSYLLNIPQTIGSSTAYVGFTAATNNTTTHRQNLSNFRFVNVVPEPSGMAMALLGAVTLLRRSRRRLQFRSAK